MNLSELNSLVSDKEIAQILGRWGFEYESSPHAFISWLGWMEIPNKLIEALPRTFSPECKGCFIGKIGFCHKSVDGAYMAIGIQPWVGRGGIISDTFTPFTQGNLILPSVGISHENAFSSIQKAVAEFIDLLEELFQAIGSISDNPMAYRPPLSS